MIDFVKNLIAPPRCAGCGERLSIFDGASEKAFCNTCRGKWEKAKRSMCSGCKRENVECICRVKALRGTKVLSLIKFGSDPSCDRLIYALKRRRNERFFDFTVDELYRRLISEGNLLTGDLSKIVFANVPRSIGSKNTFGFDHAKTLAMSLANKTGGEYRRLLLRRLGGKAQKKLSEEERQNNVKNRFIFNPSEELDGETIVLVDDVVTTGATASECVKALREKGAKEIVLLTIARAERKKSKNTTKKGKNDGAV